MYFQQNEETNHIKKYQASFHCPFLFCYINTIKCWSDDDNLSIYGLSNNKFYVKYSMDIVDGGFCDF